MMEWVQVTPEQLRKIIQKGGDYWQYITPPLDNPTIEGIFVKFTPEKEIEEINIFMKDEIYRTSQEFVNYALEEYIDRNPPMDFTVWTENP